jgi:hypothetical protein
MTTRAHIPLLLLLPLLVFGCKPAPLPATAPATNSTPSISYPPRPTRPPAPFKIFHHANSTFTLTVPESATDDQLSTLLWNLHDAAHTHSFDALHIPQKQVDADGRTVWFHIYRGTKCAPEKYAPGKTPCGDSYHAAADYTLSPQKTPPWDKGTLLHGDDHETDLWNPDAPYTGPSTASPTS